MKSINVLAILFTTFILLFATKANSQATFSFPKFTTESLHSAGSVKILPDGVLSITDIEKTTDVGRAYHKYLVPLWDKITLQLYSFFTTFTFKIINRPNTVHADGLVFFFGDINVTIPENSGQGFLGLVNSKNAILNNRFFGVEFDNFANPWDPKYAHIGVNLNSIYSSTHTKWNSVSGSFVKADIIFDAPTKILTVLVTDSEGQFFSLAQTVDFKTLLPRSVVAGFSATSGDHQSHNIYSWYYKSYLDKTPTPNIIKKTIARI